MRMIFNLKKLMALIIVMSMFIVPTYANENEVIEFIDNVVELEWGTDANDDFRTFELLINSNEEVSYESSNEAVVVVDENGKLLSRGYGETTITVTEITTGLTDQIKVKVFLVGEEETPLGPVTFIKPYVVGYENGNFMAKEDITGYELSVMLSRVLNLPLIEEKDSSWFEASIDALKEKKIINENSIFNTNDFVTRADVAIILEATLKYEKRWLLLDGYPMVYDIDESSASKSAIYTLLEFEIMFLDEESMFNPNNLVTRGDAVRIINRLIGRDPYLLGESDFEDLNEDDTFFGDIDAASSFYNLKYDY